jgi:hypothetical protein
MTRRLVTLSVSLFIGLGSVVTGPAHSAMAGPARASAAIWVPSTGTSWQWQLTGRIDTANPAAVYDVDLFDTSRSTVDQLHRLGRRVVCYVSVGSFENWRPDATAFPGSVLGRNYDGWPGERFLDIRSDAVKRIMAARLDQCQSKGFDAVEPDNMDVWENNSGFPLARADGLAYARWLGQQAHSRGLSIGQKNAPGLTADLAGEFDWALTEDCAAQGWCGQLKPYVDRRKAVFAAEYSDRGMSRACAQRTSLGLSPLRKRLSLDAWARGC